MPEVVAARKIHRPASEIWEFVQDFGAWAPLVKGYVSHTTESETDSLWTLRGDAGPLTRQVKLRVHITEFSPARVAFDMKGVGEPVDASGCFELAPEGAPPPATPPPRSWLQRLVDWLTGRKPALPAPREAQATTVRFTFRIDAQGPMGPMINAMLGPFAQGVADDLLAGIGHRLREDAAA